MESLRILHILRAPVGGLFRHVSDLSGAQAAAGHAVGVLCDDQTADALTQERLRDLEPNLKLGLHRCSIARGPAPGDIVAIRKARQLAQKLKADVIHGHGAKGGLCARLARTGPAIAVYTPHGGSLHFAPRSPSGLIFHGLERMLNRLGDVTLFESDFAKKRFETVIGRPQGIVKVVHNGLRPEDTKREMHGSVTADFGFVGELRDLKGVDLLLEAMARLVAEPSDLPQSPTLLIAGDGPDAGSLNDRAFELGLDKNVSFLGARPAAEIFEAVNTIVVPSRKESFPYVVLEAAAAGCGVIATSVGGIPEMVQGTNKALIEPDDVDALVRHMRDALHAPGTDDRDAFSTHIRTTFTVSAMAEAIEQAYRTALTQRRSATHDQSDPTDPTTTGRTVLERP